MFRSTLPAVRRDLLVRRHVGHVVQFTLLTLVHGLVGLLVPPAETKASPEASCRSGKDREWERYRKKSVIYSINKMFFVCVSIRVSTFLTHL